MLIFFEEFHDLTPRDQQTDTEIYINTTYFVLTPAIYIKLNEPLTDIKNLVYRGSQYLYFSICFNCYLAALKPTLGHSEGSRT